MRAPNTSYSDNNDNNNNKWEGGEGMRVVYTRLSYERQNERQKYALMFNGGSCLMS